MEGERGMKFIKDGEGGGRVSRGCKEGCSDTTVLQGRMKAPNLDDDVGGVQNVEDEAGWLNRHHQGPLNICGSQKSRKGRAVRGRSNMGGAKSQMKDALGVHGGGRSIQGRHHTRDEKTRD